MVYKQSIGLLYKVLPFPLRNHSLTSWTSNLTHLIWRVDIHKLFILRFLILLDLLGLFSLLFIICFLICFVFLYLGFLFFGLFIDVWCWFDISWLHKHWFHFRLLNFWCFCFLVFHSKLLLFMFSITIVDLCCSKVWTLINLYITS